MKLTKADLERNAHAALRALSEAQQERDAMAATVRSLIKYRDQAMELYADTQALHQAINEAVCAEDGAKYQDLWLAFGALIKKMEILESL